MLKDYDILGKVIIIGDSGVGKSAIMGRHCNNIFEPSFIATIGVDFKYNTVTVNGKNVKLQIWDTAGQERFRTITTSYYRGAHIIFMCYDITDRQSFQNLEMWYDEVKKYAGSNIQIVICGTKMDLTAKREVSYEEGKEYANDHGFNFYETSSKENTNVDILFEKSSKIMLENFLTDIKNTSSVVTTGTYKNRPSQQTISLEPRSLKDTVYKKCCV